eukprot:CAMPEP_0203807138 /NCGR_PEP_ID=MMETSP0115-20131106/894_1 /ASSEMBLY_ACC=CAM_ASM_000227 /TAXON_ID=33651 /ORGANISM="Bicosoecid sp, Strain ms1" /LENGTH=143 /DNA_ID=CAMNT_0050715809 /DNA_START=14 /DNA_END=445 /DNA_ORIENTATION=+
MAAEAESKMADLSVEDKMVCGEGDDCPCHTAEKHRVPKPPGKGPKKVTIEAGKTAYICMCGTSKNYPFCDGSHKAYNEAHGTSITPAAVKNETGEELVKYVCHCGHSKKRPFCDGTHAKLHPAGMTKAAADAAAAAEESKGDA